MAFGGHGMEFRQAGPRQRQQVWRLCAHKLLVVIGVLFAAAAVLPAISPAIPSASAQQPNQPAAPGPATSSPASSQSTSQTTSPTSFGLDLLRGAITDIPNRPPRPTPPPTANSPEPTGPAGQVNLSAVVTEGGQTIDKGLIWYVFGARGPDGKPRVTATHREASPNLRLAPGEYLVNVTFGRATTTRRITVMPDAQSSEVFILNVGLLKVTALLGANQPAPANTVMFDVLSDDRDQFGQRVKVITAARPGRLFRLNSGLYQIVSVYGDANATVLAEMTVEPGKLTDATVIHQAGRVTLKLVRRAGGEAIADTQWSILNRQGDIVKESAGALPTHLLAPGTYTVNARSQGQTYRRTFAVRTGDNAPVEVLAQ